MFNRFKKIFITPLLYTILALSVFAITTFSSDIKPPTILISILVRNKAHTLPYFLSHLEKLDYPKDRISLWIRSDHNVDNSIEILKKWINSIHEEYHSISTKFSDDQVYNDEDGVAHWSSMRYDHVMHLRQDALNYARSIWADYLLTIDADVFLINSRTLQLLISKDFTVVAPMLNSIGMYSNFWYGMTNDYYYLRTDEYAPVIQRTELGCFAVPMIHSCVLIDLHKIESDHLTYLPETMPNYDGPLDDIIVFALSANKSRIELNVCNEETFGFIMVPMEHDGTLSFDYWQLINLKLEVLVENEPLHVNDLLKQYTFRPNRDTLGFDKIYLINLLRRHDRRKRMLACFEELGLEVTILDAVDGKSLNESALKGIEFLPGYADPYHKRPMKLGEIGCFLSHYNIWNEVLENNYEKVLVLEDDVRFEPFFRLKVGQLMKELDRMKNWDLVYFGRKNYKKVMSLGSKVPEMLVKVSYSYWTLGYAVSLRGAQKLIEAEPLSRLLPVDEYLPILFDKHPVSDWKVHFSKRDLIAFSVAPLLLYPTHYTGEKGYVSDTEDSNIVEAAKVSLPRSDL